MKFSFHLIGQRPKDWLMALSHAARKNLHYDQVSDSCACVSTPTQPCIYPRQCKRDVAQLAFPWVHDSCMWLVSLQVEIRMMVAVYQHKISIYLSTYLSIYLSIFLSIYLSVYIYIHTCIYIYIYISLTLCCRCCSINPLSAARQDSSPINGTGKACRFFAGMVCFSQFACR